MHKVTTSLGNVLGEEEEEEEEEGHCMYIRAQ
jgi:hypothetical protein